MPAPTNSHGKYWFIERLTTVPAELKLSICERKH